ncbi:hypothetical protein R3P38DRAFT_2398224, partial [Favolaschia claudopus]
PTAPSAPPRQHAPVRGVSQNLPLPPVTLHAPRYHPAPLYPQFGAPPPVPLGHPPAPARMASRPLPHTPAPAIPSLSDLYSSASGHIADLGPVPKPFSLLSSGWTDADKLALERYNWIPWSQKVKNQLGMASGAWRFLERDNPCPSFQVYPAHYRAWIDADMVVRCFLSEVCAVTERPYFEQCTSAAEVWETLLMRHTCRGPMGQIEALRSFLSVELSFDPKSWATPLTALRDLNSAIWASGTPDPDSFHLTGLLIALSRHNGDFVRGLVAQPDLTLASALRSVTALMVQPAPTGTGGFAFAASSAGANSRQPPKKFAGKREICSTPNCGTPGTHTWPYCTAPGGGMAGRPVSEAQTKAREDRHAQRAANGGSHIKRNAAGAAYTTLGGVDYLLTPSIAPPVAPAAPAAAAHIAQLTTDPLPPAD